MRWPDIYLLCFAVGALWSLATLLLGGFHLGHSGSRLTSATPARPCVARDGCAAGSAA